MAGRVVSGAMGAVRPLPHVGRGIPAALRRAAAEGALPAVEAQGDVTRKPLGLFYDLDAWEANLTSCQEAFGPGFFHALALKSNGLGHMLRWARDRGCGAECASIGEVVHAQRLGFQGQEIIFDSPVKTHGEIRHALAAGAHVNIDNMEELMVVAEARRSLPESTSVVGLRINPLVGAGQISALSVSTDESKFGVPIDRRAEILEAFRQHPWLSCVHVHVGSGGMGARILAAGVRTAVELALEINANAGRAQVQTLDMGGGVPVNYGSEEWHSSSVPSFREYAEVLRAEVPALFPGHAQCPFLRVITEFGQSLNAKSGWLASRVEYTKPLPGSDGQIVLIHFGADLCPRQCYTTDHNRRIEFYDGQTMELKELSAESPLSKVRVAGPLCFQGDFLTTGAEAPRLRRGDIVVLREAGANTMSLFSRHCLRQGPAAYGYRSVGSSGGVEATEWRLLKRAEDPEGCSQHWEPEEPASESAEKKARLA
mmetsp:Transcript_48535/g.138731  ORF Transcript_48535/g.138731 Transcript_48535/m.138731 type:complete len:484 (-) Transcript_48535:432-1883(-)